MKIAIAFIENQKGQIYVTRRALDSHLGGYWELPGGKIESDETSTDAIYRELKEELDIDVQQASLFKIVEDELVFYLYEVNLFLGTIKHCSGQLDGRWMSLEETKHYLFPPKNYIFFQEWQTYKSE